MQVLLFLPNTQQKWTVPDRKRKVETTAVSETKPILVISTLVRFLLAHFQRICTKFPINSLTLTSFPFKKSENYIKWYYAWSYFIRIVSHFSVDVLNKLVQYSMKLSIAAHEYIAKWEHLRFEVTFRYHWMMVGSFLFSHRITNLNLLLMQLRYSVKGMIFLTFTLLKYM